jgi:hypothetical protein
MRRASCVLVVGGCLLALVVQGCQQPPAQQAEQPKRKSFEESDGSWQPISKPAADSSAPAGSGGNAGNTPQDIQQGWKAAESAQGDAAKQRAAGEMLNRTREMADQSNKPPQ